MTQKPKPHQKQQQQSQTPSNGQRQQQKKKTSWKKIKMKNFFLVQQEEFNLSEQKTW